MFRMANRTLNIVIKQRTIKIRYIALLPIEIAPPQYATQYEKTRKTRYFNSTVGAYYANTMQIIGLALDHSFIFTNKAK